MTDPLPPLPITAIDENALPRDRSALDERRASIDARYPNAAHELFDPTV